MFRQRKFDRAYAATVNNVEHLDSIRKSLLPNIEKHYSAVQELRNYPEYWELLEDATFGNYASEVLTSTYIAITDDKTFTDQKQHVYDLHNELENPNLSRKERRMLEAEILNRTESLHDEIVTSLEDSYRSVRELPNMTERITAKMRGKEPITANETYAGEHLQKAAFPAQPSWTQLEFEKMYTNVATHIGHNIQTRNTVATEVKKYYLASQELLKYPAAGNYIEEIDALEEMALIEARDPMFMYQYNLGKDQLQNLYPRALADRTYEMSVLNTATAMNQSILQNTKICIKTAQELTKICKVETSAMRAEVEKEHQEEHIMDYEYEQQQADYYEYEIER